MATVEVNNDPVAWSTGLETLERRSVFNSSQWLESLSTDESKPVYLDLVENREVVARMGGLAVGRRHTKESTLLFYAGPATRTGLGPDRIREIYRAIFAWAKKHGFNHLAIATYDYPHCFPRCRKFIYRERTEYIVDLTRSLEEICREISRNIRQCSHRAARSGYSVRESGEHHLTARLIELMDETRKARISKGYPDYNYFHLPYSAEESLGHMVEEGSMVYYVAEKQQEVHGIIAVIQVARGAYAIYLGIAREGYRLGVSQLLDWWLIQHMKEMGYEYINFGGIPQGEFFAGLIEYKRKLGCAVQTCYQASTANLLFPYNLANPFYRLLGMLPEKGFSRRISRGLLSLVRVFRGKRT